MPLFGIFCCFVKALTKPASARTDPDWQAIVWFVPLTLGAFMPARDGRLTNRMWRFH
jgi:hypothetical protein